MAASTSPVTTTPTSANCQTASSIRNESLRTIFIMRLPLFIVFIAVSPVECGSIPVGGGWVLPSPFPLALEHSLVEPGRGHLTETESFSDGFLCIRDRFAKVGRRGAGAF